MKLIILTSLLLASLLLISCAPNQDFEARLGSILKPHLFSIAGWESRTLPQELNGRIFRKYGRTNHEINVVTGYFASTQRIKTLQLTIAAAKAKSNNQDLASLETERDRLQKQTEALASQAARIIAKQIRDNLTEQGIFNPITDWKISFPPVNFRLEKPPYLLVISPRDRIEPMREITLQPSLTLKQIETIEAKVDELGVSSLVVALGGLGATYPTLVADEASLKSAIDTTLHEWLHQYLAFKPLGFRYLLDLTGLARNYEIATMNETIAGMVSQEISAIIYEKYYAQYEDGDSQNQTPPSDFDFNREMREIRQRVDDYLARGEIAPAEEFMKQKQQYLAAKGYYIRKLNQAYFAFHGTYADSPTSISPIGVELKKLRAKSASVKDFLNRAAALTSRAELRQSVD